MESRTALERGGASSLGEYEMSVVSSLAQSFPHRSRNSGPRRVHHHLLVIPHGAGRVDMSLISGLTARSRRPSRCRDPHSPRE